jgi:hypothetical protein
MTPLPRARATALLTSLVLALSACAGTAAPGTVRARYPDPPPGTALAGGEPPATLVLEFTYPVDRAIVSIDGAAVVSGVRARRLVIERVPPGEVAVMLAADGGVEKAFRVRLDPGSRVVVPIAAPAPARPAQNPFTQALLTVAVYAAYMGLARLF